MSNRKLILDDPAEYYRQVGAEQERERIINLLENQIYCRRYEGLFWKDTIDKVSIPELVALIKGGQK